MNPPSKPATPEHARLAESSESWPGTRKALGRLGTVREDYSADGRTCSYFPHEYARSRAYRWNEDGLAGVHQQAGGV